MFSNLVESASHRKDFKRRGSFFVVTLAGYALLLACAGVVSVFAYHASVEAQNLELITLVQPTLETPQIAQRTPARPASANDVRQIATRRNPMESITSPNKVSAQISSAPVNEKPIAPGVPFKAAPFDSDPVGGASSVGKIGGVGSENGTTKNDASETAPPPPRRETPPPVKPQTPSVIKAPEGVLKGKAVHLVQPAYPTIAKIAHVSGAVPVQILIDESGRVVSAHAAGGHPLLQQAAVQAALQSRFSPTLLSGQPVKVSGVITFNFIMQ